MGERLKMSTLTEVLDDWYQRVAATQRAHYISADYYGRKKYWLGIPAVVLSTIVGTSVFAMIAKQPGPYVQIAVGLASVGAALLTSLQTFLGYSERAEKHRVSGAKYGALGRELEVLRANQTVTPEVVESVRKRLDTLALEAPNNSVEIYNRAGGAALEGKPAELPAELRVRN
jgi:hypothetical protein